MVAVHAAPCCPHADGQLLGYSPALERRLPSAHSGIQKLLLLRVLEQLKTVCRPEASDGVPHAS
jgi:hypothetical protein